MRKPVTIRMRKLMQKLFISTLLLTVVALAFASKGGGGEKKAANVPVKTDFVPIRTMNNFTLKAGPSYSGSILLNQERTTTSISFSTLVTYQKGNSIFVMPYKYKINMPNMLNGGQKSSLQLIDLHIQMHK